jgi:hypothetical protein
VSDFIDVRYIEADRKKRRLAELEAYGFAPTSEGSELVACITCGAVYFDSKNSNGNKGYKHHAGLFHKQGEQ